MPVSPWFRIVAVVGGLYAGAACAAACSSGASGGAASDGGSASGTGPDGSASNSSSGSGASSSGGTGEGGLGANPDGGPSFGFGGGDGGSSACAGGTVGGSRPVQVRTFAGYDCTTPAPLVLLLHDYGSTGDQEEAYLDFNAQADALGFLYAHPDGTKDSRGNQFWNATDACCNIDGSQVDDSTYLFDVISNIRAQYNVDKTRIYVVGHGNGGFMAYRLTCDHGLYIAGVADFGGSTWSSASKCPLQAPVNVVEIHGTADGTFSYNGGTNLGASYPSAPGTAAEWVSVDRCKDASAAAGAGLDLLGDDAGTEDGGFDTTVLTWGSCPGKSEIDLWTIQGGTHQPALSPTFASTVLGFLLARPKP